jgi:hypothetical protein
VEVEPPVPVIPGTLGIDNTGSRHILALDGDGLAPKVDVAVAVAGVDARGDEDRVAIVGIVDGRLDRGEMILSE